MNKCGAPLLVAGSNGHVAWAFTNSYGHWLEVTPVTCLAVEDSQLRTPQGTIALWQNACEEELRREGRKIRRQVKRFAGPRRLTSKPKLPGRMLPEIMEQV